MNTTTALVAVMALGIFATGSSLSAPASASLNNNVILLPGVQSANINSTADQATTDLKPFNIAASRQIKKAVTVPGNLANPTANPSGKIFCRVCEDRLRACIGGNIDDRQKNIRCTRQLNFCRSGCLKNLLP